MRRTSLGNECINFPQTTYPLSTKYFHKIGRKRWNSLKSIKKLRKMIFIVDINAEHNADCIIWKVKLIIQSFEKKFLMSLWKKIYVMMNQ